MKALFDVVGVIKGAALTQIEVDLIEVALAAPDPFEDDALVATVARHLEEEEGRVRHAYCDHLGYWTIGVGRMIDQRRGGGLSDAEIDLLLVNDIRERVDAVQGWPAWKRVADDPVRAAALVSMAFQMGTAGLAKFGSTLNAIAAGRFDYAASAMLASRWATQTPGRAKRVAAMMRDGKIA